MKLYLLKATNVTAAPCCLIYLTAIFFTFLVFCWLRLVGEQEGFKEGSLKGN